jgi:predicted MFS family arabinose efflux permease
VAFFLVREQRYVVDSGALLSNAGGQLKNVFNAGTMWAAAGLMALFYIAPGTQTALFYKQQNDLHMGTQAQGILQLMQGIGGVTAAVLYALVCRRFDLRTLLWVCLTASTLTNLGYLKYDSVLAANIQEMVNGFGFSLAELALMDLAVRSTPRGSEGLGYSLMLSVRNLAIFGTDWIGSQLMDRFHLPFSGLVIANSLTTAISVPLVFLLPRALVQGRDAEAPHEAPAPRVAEQV